jgi:hypothetical protein
MTVSARYTFGLNATETLSTGVPAAPNANVVHSGYDETAILDADSTPPLTQVSYFLLTLTAGAATINLAALAGANGTIDGTGLRVQALRVKNLGANTMTFAEGASNGIALACLPFTVPAGSTNTAVSQFLLGDASPDIAAGDRTIDVSGTASQTAEVTIWLG